MAAKAKAAKGGMKAAKGKSRAAKRNAYVQDVLHNQRVHDRARSGVRSVQTVYGRVSRKRGGANILLDDRKTRKELRRALVSFRDAAATVRGAKKRRRRRVGAPAAVTVVALTGAGVVASNEELRRKITGLMGGGGESPSQSGNGGSDAPQQQTPANDVPATTGAGDGTG